MLETAISFVEKSAAEDSAHAQLLRIWNRLSTSHRVPAFTKWYVENSVVEFCASEVMGAAAQVTLAAWSAKVETAAEALDDLRGVVESFQIEFQQNRLDRHFTESVWRDFDRLSALRSEQKWSNHTAVSVNVFDEMWPKGIPQGWSTEHRVAKTLPISMQSQTNEKAIAVLPKDVVAFLAENPDYEIRSRGSECGPLILNRLEYLELSQQILVPAIIDRSMFETARIQMDENRKRHRQDKAKGKYLLSGFTMCGRCGAAYCSRIARGNNKYHYYRCLRSDGSRTALEDRCENKSVKGAGLEQMVWDEICKLLQDPARLKQELVRQHHKDDIDEKLRLAQREAINVVKQIDRLIDLYTEDKITKDELDKRLPELRKRQEEQSLEIKKYEQDQLTDDTLQDAQTRLEELAHMVQSQLSTADWCLKQELCLLLVKRIEIHDQEVKIVLKAPHLPFDYGPDENRGFLHQRLPCVAQPNGLGVEA